MSSDGDDDDGRFASWFTRQNSVDCSPRRGSATRDGDNAATERYPCSRSSPRSRRRRGTGYSLSALAQAFPRFRSGTITIPVRHARGCWRTK